MKDDGFDIIQWSAEYLQIKIDDGRNVCVCVCV